MKSFEPPSMFARRAFTGITLSPLEPTPYVKGYHSQENLHQGLQAYKKLRMGNKGLIGFLTATTGNTLSPPDPCLMGRPSPPGVTEMVSKSFPRQVGLSGFSPAFWGVCGYPQASLVTGEGEAI